jgi:hopanoid C-2 methylase
VLTINVLYALPKTPLWRRLEVEGRLRPEAGRDSNIMFRLPEETVLQMWRRCIAAAYEPEAIYGRFAYNFAHTFARRPAFPRSSRRNSWRNVGSGVALLARLVWRIGIRGDYRSTFWRLARPALQRGQVEELLQAAVVSHHLIEFTRQSLVGAAGAAFYAPAADPPAVPSDLAP